MHPPIDDLAWAALIDDLDASAHADREGIALELTAAYAAEISLAERLLSAVGDRIRVRLAPCPEIEGTLMGVGRDHLWVADPHGSWLLVTTEIDGVAGVPVKVRAESTLSLISQRGLGSALRELIGIGRSISVLVGDRWAEGQLKLVGADFAQIGDLCVPLGRVRACRVWY